MSIKLSKIYSFVEARQKALAETAGAAKQLWEFECAATDIYGLFLPTLPPCGTELTAGFIKTE